MRSLTKVVMLFLLCTTASTALAEDGAEEAAVKQVVLDIAKSWNQPGMPGFEDLFIANADFVVISGQWLKGRDEIVEYHRNLLANRYNGSHLTIDSVVIRFIRSDVAVAHFGSHVLFTMDGKEVSRSALGTIALSKSDGKWRIDALQNTLNGGTGWEFGK